MNGYNSGYQLGHPTTSGTYDGASAPADTSEAPLSRELNAMVNGLAELEQAIGELGQRLDPISLRAPKGVAPDKNQQADSPVVDSLRVSNERIRGLACRVIQLRSELQV